MEQAAVNRKVEGSNPFSGAKESAEKNSVLLFFLLTLRHRESDVLSAKALTATG